MRKLVAAFNMMLDGSCDHTSGIADEEIHRHYTELLNSADAILYGRVAYNLMEFWMSVLQNPTGNKAMDEFAVAIDNVPKIVFSGTLKTLEWKSAHLATKGLKEEILELKQQPGRDIFIGSRSLIVAAMNLGLLDELQICIHPVLAGSGLPLFKDLDERVELKLLKTKTFGGGHVIHYYEPKINK